MKNLNFLKPALFVFAILAFSSCDREDEVDVSINSLNEDEVVALVEGALTSDTEGVAKASEDAITLTEESLEKTPDQVCGMSMDTTVSRNYNGARISSVYTLQWDWILTCNDLMIPQTFTFNRTLDGSYESLRLISEDSATGSWEVSNLITGDAYILNGSYMRGGNQGSKVRLQNSFESTISVTLTEVTVDKQDYQITGGTGSFDISGSGTGGYSIDYEGTIIFLGNGTAEITINGNTYIIDLN